MTLWSSSSVTPRGVAKILDQSEHPDLITDISQIHIGINERTFVTWMKFRRPGCQPFQVPVCACPSAIAWNSTALWRQTGIELGVPLEFDYWTIYCITTGAARCSSRAQRKAHLTPAQLAHLQVHAWTHTLLPRMRTRRITRTPIPMPTKESPQ